MAYLGVDGEHLQNAELVQDLPLFPEPRGSRGYLGDPSILGEFPGNCLNIVKNFSYKIKLGIP